MKKLFRWPRRNRNEIQTEVDEEIRFHLDMRIAELVSSGMALKDARDKAFKEFGDVDQARRALSRADLRNESRKRRSEWTGEMLQDLKYAARTLRRSRTFALVASLTLAVGL